MQTNASGPHLFCAASWYSMNISPGICRILIGPHPQPGSGDGVVHRSLRCAQAILRAARSRGILAARFYFEASQAAPSRRTIRKGEAVAPASAQLNVNSPIGNLLLVVPKLASIPSANRPARTGRASCDPSLYLPAATFSRPAPIEVNMKAPPFSAVSASSRPHADKVGTAFARVVIALRVSGVVRLRPQSGASFFPERGPSARQGSISPSGKRSTRWIFAARRHSFKSHLAIGPQNSPSGKRPFSTTPLPYPTCVTGSRRP